MKNIQSQNQHGDAPRSSPPRVRRLGTWAQRSRIPSAKTKMKIRNQKLTTPTLIRILRRLVHRRAFQQRKIKAGTSLIAGAAAAALASLEQASTSSAINRVRSDFRSRQP